MKKTKTNAFRIFTLSALLGLSLIVQSLVLARPPVVKAATTRTVTSAGGRASDIGAFEVQLTPNPAPTPTPTPTANFIVNSTDDSVDVNPGNGICETAPGNGVCTLRAAIQEAPADNTIGFDLPAGSTIVLTNGELLISRNLTISGPGANLLTVTRSVTAVNFRIFDIAAGLVMLSGFTISNGNSLANLGGGIYDASPGIVDVTNVIIVGNSAGQGNGGGIHMENTGILQVNNSIISGNFAGSGGGGISNVRGTVHVTDSTISFNSGQGIFNEVLGTATVTVIGSTISGNFGDNGGGIFNRDPSGIGTTTVTVTNSTISGNSAASCGGGVRNAILGSAGSGGTITLNILNSTISGNSAGGGGGICTSGDNPVTVNLTDSTVAGNSGGGIANSGAGGVVIARNSIIAKNTANTSPDFSGALTSLGYNLIGNNAGATITPANTIGDQIGTPGSPINPFLGILQDNGGPTFTRALLSGSPAIDKGLATTGSTTDQRGLLRPVDDPAIANAAGGNGSDIGAFEVQAPTPTPTPSPTPTPTPASCVNVSVPTGQTALKNSTLTVPVNVSDTTGAGIVSFDFTLNYDSMVLTTPATPYDQTGTLSSAFTITVNSSTPGQLVISGFGTAALSGSGTLLKLKFNVAGSANACSNLNLSAFHFNEGTPCASTTNGQMCVNSGTISGVVTYGTASGSARPVPGVTLSAAGTPNTSTTSDGNGAYSLSGLGIGPYTVKPTRTPEVTGITSFDAALVAQYVVGLIMLTPNQQIAADVSNNGAITSFDAALIAQTAVGLQNESIAGTWKFVPPSRTYPSTLADQPNQDYEAILLGDVSGNWTPPGSGAISPPALESTQIAANPAISISLPQTSAAHGASISIPITSGDLSSQNVISYDFDLAFDPNVLQPQSSPADSSGTMSSGLSLTANRNNSGHLRVAGFGIAPLMGSGTLLNLNFTVVGGAGVTTRLTAQTFEFNEGNPGVTTANGQFTVATPTESSGTISGTIDDSSGNPVAGVAMRLNGTQNRLTITDAGGHYHFDNVETNGLYTVTPSRANFTFSPRQRSFSQSGPHTDAAFSASPTSGGLNPLDTIEYFVRQQYLDFLNREPDEGGFNFWVNNIESCGADANCREVKRIDTSAAFFLSIEFQQTGYLVERTYRAAYGDMSNAPVPIKLSEFNPDTSEIGNGVVVLQSGWEQVLENNKQAYIREFVRRARFTAAYPVTLSPSEFVDKLFMNVDLVPADTDRMTAINEFGLTNTSADVAARGRALRRVAENSTLAQREFNQAFVLMQYFGYLLRNPVDAPEQTLDYQGYNFWLTKLNTFNGNFQDAEMVKAFLTSIEYRGRFPR